MAVDFDLKETGQKEDLNGFDTREIVMTITLREEQDDRAERRHGADERHVDGAESFRHERDRRNLSALRQQAGRPMVAGASAQDMAGRDGALPDDDGRRSRR
jgi:hypothetical protein